jgi:hypothetical protein
MKHSFVAYIAHIILPFIRLNKYNFPCNFMLTIEFIN